MNMTKPDENPDPYGEGVEAYHSGDCRASNPYDPGASKSDEKRFSEWDNGWCEFAEEDEL